MMWTPVGSHGLEVVLEPLTRERVFHTLDKLQDGSQGPTQPSTWLADHQPLGAHRLFEHMKALFFPAREPIGSWHKAAEHVVWSCQGQSCCFCHFGGPAKWL